MNAHLQKKKKNGTHSSPCKQNDIFGPACIAGTHCAGLYGHQKLTSSVLLQDAEHLGF